MIRICLKITFVFALLLVGVNDTNACRFTVREIGFSTLSQDVYTLAVIDEQLDLMDQHWKELRTNAKQGNLRVLALHPKIDSEHPLVLKAKSKNLRFPVVVLSTPDGRIYPFNNLNQETIFAQSLTSPIRERIRQAFPLVFSVVIWVEGRNTNMNTEMEEKVSAECNAIENIMPTMPKLVKKGPLSVCISQEQFQSEKLLLWSLGIDSIPEEPIAFVLYGRGRLMGKGLSYKDVMDGALYNYMSMIGADCECGLDKKWMLGRQIPMIWNKEASQVLTDLIGFDVDNPMILAEMSRILTKESMDEATGSIGFAPESYNLDEIFGDATLEDEATRDEVPESKSRSILMYTLIALLIGVLIGGLVLFIKR